MSRKKLYLAIDAHARHSVLGCMDTRGNFLRSWRFPTSEKEFINHVSAINAGKKILTIEEGPLAYWISQALTSSVTEIIIADPREIPLVSRNAQKRDKLDVRNLCRLLRLGELRRVYHPEDNSRAVFKAAVQQYIDFRGQQTRLKQKIKAKYRCWGIPHVDGKELYHPQKRQVFLKQLQSTAVRNQLKRLYSLLDCTVSMQELSLREASSLARNYSEINEFVKVPGVGLIGALIFDAYIQTPYRFAKKSRLYRYCRLSVADRSSDGKLLAHKKLDKAGNGELKAFSNRAFIAAMNMKEENEVKKFYNRSLQRTNDHTRSRLSTQRKILSVLHGVWRRKEEYRPELFTRT